MAISPDTIAAVATPGGRGGVGIIRVSGSLVPDIAEGMTGRLPEPRRATLAEFRGDDHAIIDQGLMLYFPGSASFTGEPVLEIHGHGGLVVMDLLLRRVLALGARPARAGEFTERAFLNDKIDLAQAEAVADLIDSVSEASARSAVRSLSGEFSACISDLTEQLIQLRVYVEAAIDFPEEEIDFLADERIVKRLDAIAILLKDVRVRATQGSVLREGITLAIVGPPNAGKSSLMNRLSGQPVAIVSAQAGTTRDVLREQLVIRGMPVQLVDTAGIRSTADDIEQEGVRRALSEVTNANVVLLVIDQSGGPEIVKGAIRGMLEELKDVLDDFDGDMILVFNKNDIASSAGSVSGVDLISPLIERVSQVSVSVVTGNGFDALYEQIERSAGMNSTVEGVFMARRRHLDALARAAEHVMEGQAQLTMNAAGELLAEELRSAQRSLGEITGEFSSDDLLGRIFESFCIGK